MDTPPVSLPYRTQLASSLSALVSMWWSPAFRAGLIGASGQSLGLSEARILWELGYRGTARPGDLAEAMEVGAPSVTKAITKLRARGLVEQTEDATDRRARRVRLTPTGTVAAQALYDVGDEMVGNIVQAWTPAEVEHFAELLAAFVSGAATFAGSIDDSLPHAPR